MATKTVSFNVRTLVSEVAVDQIDNCEVKKDPKGKEWAVRTGSINVYDDDELSELKDAGLSDYHADLLNQIIVIRAQDVIRQTMRGKSALDPETKQLAKDARDAMKLDPSVRAQIEALLAKAKGTK